MASISRQNRVDIVVNQSCVLVPWPILPDLVDGRRVPLVRYGAILGKKTEGRA